MNPGLLALAIGLAAAGVLGVATRDTRSAVVAFAVLAVASPILAAGPPEPLALAARLVAGLLAAYLLWAAVRGHAATAGSPLGLVAEAVLAVAGGLAAYAGALAASGAESVAAGGGTTVAAAGPPETVAAGVALLVSGAGPLLASRDALRTSIGALVLVHGAWLVRAGLLGPAAAVEELALAVFVAVVGACGAAMIVRARGGSGTLDLGARRSVASASHTPADEAPPLPGGDGSERGRGRRPASRPRARRGRSFPA